MATPTPDPHPALSAALAALLQLRDLPRLQHLAHIESLALEANQPRMVIRALSDQIQLANRLDRLEDQIAALQRMHHLYTHDPACEFAREQVILYHKWIVEPLAERADIPLDLINSMCDRLDALFAAENVGTRATDLLRCRTAWIMGNAADAQRFYDSWKSAPPGKSDDCKACILNAQIEYLLSLEPPPLEEIFQLAEPLLSGQLRCAEVPAISYSRLMLPALHLGKSKLAHAMHRVTRRTVRKKPDLLAALARHLFFLTITGQAATPTARRMAALALTRAPKALDYGKFGAYLYAAFWFSVLALEGTPAIKLPRAFPLAGPDGLTPTPDAAAFCLTHARDIAAKFDARNGNPTFANRVADMEYTIRHLPTGDAP